MPIQLPNNKEFDCQIAYLVGTRIPNSGLLINFFGVPRKAIEDVMELRQSGIRIRSSELPSGAESDLVNHSLEIPSSGYNAKQLAENIIQHLTENYNLVVRNDLDSSSK